MAVSFEVPHRLPTSYQNKASRRMHKKKQDEEIAHIFGGGGGRVSSDMACGTVSDVGPHFPHMSALTFHRSAQYIYSSNAPRSHHAAFDFLPHSSSAPEWASLYFSSVVFSTALLRLRGRRSFPIPSFLNDRPSLSLCPSNQGLW